MKKKSRYRKKASRMARVEADNLKSNSKEEIDVEKTPEELERRSSIDAAPACSEKASSSGIKKEMVFGFGVLGAMVGFLVGYGNLMIIEGITDGLLGFFIGAGLGYIPYISTK